VTRRSRALLVCGAFVLTVLLMPATAGAQSPVVPRYKVDARGEIVPDVRAAAALIYNPQTGEVLFDENGQAQRSIASITKVMTAVVFLADDPDFSREAKVVLSDVRNASTTYLRSGDRLTVDGLLHLLLIGSDNAAARTLARISPYGSEGFIERMNEKAAELGLTSTHYADPSGLLSENVSSAYDMARLIAHASSDVRVSSIMQKAEDTVKTARRPIRVRSTNHLLRSGEYDIRAGKTGYIRAAGYCLVTLVRLPETAEQLAVVVLGARSNSGRFAETQNLFNWLSTRAPSLFATTAHVAPE
jgi:D-alanyl-D-alanine endopeptidase (penicillin-binding protein 7)